MKIECAHDDLIDLHKLVPNPRNPNHHPDKQIKMLANIIDYQGQRAPIVVSNQSGFIVKGHGRLEAIKLLGWEKAAVDFQDYESEAQEFADLIADNKIAELAQHDDNMMLEGIKHFEIDDFELLGLDDFALPDEPIEAQCDEDEVPENADTRCKPGDIWQLGRHRLMCGDSTSIDAVERLMGGEKADLLLTDPPYNQETDGGPDGPIGSALRKQSREIAHMCDFDPKDVLAILPSLFSSGMNALVFCSKDLVVDYLQWAKDSGYAYNILVWKKPNAIPIGGSYRLDIEYLLAFRKSAIFNSNLDDVSYSKVLEHSRVKDKVHPTMKPVELLENQIRIGSKESVVDLFGGSGSTLIACEKTNRKCFMMELDPHYCDVILARWEKYTGKEAVRIEG